MAALYCSGMFLCSSQPEQPPGELNSARLTSSGQHYSNPLLLFCQLLKPSARPSCHVLPVGSDITRILSPTKWSLQFPVFSKHSIAGGGNGKGFNNNNFSSDDNENNEPDPNQFEWWFLTPFLLVFYQRMSIPFCISSCTRKESKWLILLFVFLLVYFWHSPLISALAKISHSGIPEFMWEVKGDMWTRVFFDNCNDTLSVDSRTVSSSSSSSSVLIDQVCWWGKCCEIFLRQLILPEGYPDTVSSDYLEYSFWRGIQGIASQINSILSTQALLYAVGLGKGAIPTAATLNWVLKDGIGYLSKILLSKYGPHFDVNPKGWRLFADLLENTAHGMELLTPVFPHHFVLIGAAAGAGKSAAALIQAATRNCFYAGFATQRNFAEVIAKGEAQGMMSKCLGIILGISMTNCASSSTALALACFSLISGIHLYCNLRSYQSVQLRTLNPYRASLIFSEYLLSGQMPTVKEVNYAEPLFPRLLSVNMNFTHEGTLGKILSAEAKEAAAEIEHRLQLGSRLSEVVNSKDDALALFDLFINERYMLMEHDRNFCVILKEGFTPEDMLRALFHVNYLYWLEKKAGIESRNAVCDCALGGRSQISLDYVEREFSHVKHDGHHAGWITDGLIARPSLNKIRIL